MKRFLILITLLGLIPTISAMAPSSNSLKLSTNTSEDLNQQLLKEARSRCDINKILALIKKGADVNIQNKHGETTLMNAAGKGLTKVCLALIENGADVNTQDNDGDTALMWALALIEENGADDNDGNAALMRGTDEDYLEVCLTLIKNGADVNLQNNDGYTALMWAVKNGNLEIHLEICLVLIEKGADLNVQDKDGRTTLMFAVYYHDLKLCLALIDKGADLNIQNEDDYTTLMLAIEQDLAEVCLALINKGADLNIKDRAGDTALEWAAMFGNAEACRTILSHAIILPQPSNENCLLPILYVLKNKKVSKDMRFYILGQLPLENLLGLLLPCKKYPTSLWNKLAEEIEKYTQEQLIPMMINAREKASGELKNLLDPEQLNENFGEALRSNIKKAVRESKLYLFKPVGKADTPMDID